MESNLINMLGKQGDRLDDYPQLKQRIIQHAKESERQADRVEQCLKALGADTSALKEGMAKLAGKVSPMGAAMASDEVVKICLANISAEHFEMACYRSLQVAAEHCGETHVAQVASEILREEEEMARFLEGQLKEVTLTWLDRKAGAHVR